MRSDDGSLPPWPRRALNGLAFGPVLLVVAILIKLIFALALGVTVGEDFGDGVSMLWPLLAAAAAGGALHEVLGRPLIVRSETWGRFVAGCIGMVPYAFVFTQMATQDFSNVTWTRRLTDDEWLLLAILTVGGGMGIALADGPFLTPRRARPSPHPTEEVPGPPVFVVFSARASQPPSRLAEFDSREAAEARLGYERELDPRRRIWVEEARRKGTRPST